MLTPTPALELLPNCFVNARFIAADMDGTLTQNGCFSPPLLTALDALKQGAWPVMIVTGRSAGWVHGVASYLPVVGAIAENGGVFCLSEQAAGCHNVPEVNILADLDDRTAHRQRLMATFRHIQSHYPHLKESADNQFRLTDWTFDIQGLSPSDIDAIAQICCDQGWSFTYSTVQCHITPQAQAKATAVKSVLARFFPHYSPAEVVTVGDSPNDVSLFDPAHFDCSVGVANIANYRDRLQHFPIHLTPSCEVEGFCELAHALLNQLIQGTK